MVVSELENLFDVNWSQLLVNSAPLLYDLEHALFGCLFRWGELPMESIDIV